MISLNSTGLPLYIEGLSVCYWDPITGNPVFALRGINLQVAGGMVLGVTGESGGGKSTLAKALLGLINHQPGIIHGTIKIEDPLNQNAPLPDEIESRLSERKTLLNYLRSKGFRRWRKIFQKQASAIRRSGTFLLLQEPRDTLHPYLPIRKMIEGCLRKRKRTGEYGEDLSVKQALDLVELPSNVSDKYPIHLSTGMCQRVHLAMAFASGLRFLIADEPLIRVDVRTRFKIANLIRRLQKENQFTMILLSHDLDLIQNLTDHLMILKGGRIVEEGTTQEVLNHPSKPYSEDLIHTFNRLQSSHSMETSRSSAQPEVTSIKIVDVIKTYPEIVAVDKVKLSVKRGETFGLLGESGCGKTTLARLVIGLDQPDGGSIELDLGEANRFRPNQLPPKEWRQARSKIQLIYQDADTALDPSNTAFECIEEAYLIHYPEISQIERKKLVESLFHSLQLPLRKFSTLASYLSGGEVRRVVIAQSMAALGYGLEFPEKESYRVLIADEPTTGMDAKTYLAFVHFLRQCREEMNLTMLLISHDLPILRMLCNRAAVMFQGKWVESGSDKILAYDRCGARHPFTHQLISASQMKKEEAIIDSEYREENAFTGCAFFSYCQHPKREVEQCGKPPPLQGNEEHQVACWFEKLDGEEQ